METLKNALKELYAPSTVRAILNGSRRPNLENIVIMREKHGIPIDAWLDIKSYLESMPDAIAHDQVESEEKSHLKETA